MRHNRQVIRLLGLLKALQHGERPYVEQLAGRFHVRRETIYRDIRALEELGFPICGDIHGIKSRPNLPPDFSTQAVSIPFSPSELLAITFAASSTDHLTGTPLGDDLRSAPEKVRSHMPGPMQDRFALTTPLFGPYRKGAKSYKAHKATIATLCQTMLERHRCLVEYQSPQRQSPSHFTLDPYWLFEFQGGLYVFAYVPIHEAVITLAVERIQQLTATNEPFTVIDGFSFEAMRDQAFGLTAETPMTVVIRFSSAVAPYIRERIWHPTQQLTELRNGNMTLRFRAGGAIEITRWVLSWGRDATVLQPKVLRQQITEQLQAAAHLYQCGVRCHRSRVRCAPAVR